MYFHQWAFSSLHPAETAIAVLPLEKNKYKKSPSKRIDESVLWLCQGFIFRAISIWIEINFDDDAVFTWWHNVERKKRNFYNANISGWLQSANFALFASLVEKKAFDEF